MQNFFSRELNAGLEKRRSVPESDEQAEDNCKNRRADNREKFAEISCRYCQRKAEQHAAKIFTDKIHGIHPFIKNALSKSCKLSINGL